ncbi:MAG: hypothetical protein HOI95_28350 [Chromatiales bacterium]|jgi:acetolactate synthase regulatory subunit|nr:hypothetical protein [Chromatiales bacterium]
MNDVHNFTISSLHAPTVLPRIALVFSRRGVVIKRLEMHALDEDAQALISLDARCDAPEADKILGQLRRIVEVSEVGVRASNTLLDVRQAS